MAEAVEGPGDAWFTDTATVALLAHGLLGNLSALRLIVDRALSSPAAEREQLLGLAEGQIEMMADVLQELARGLPPEVIASLTRRIDLERR